LKQFEKTWENSLEHFKKYETDRIEKNIVGHFGLGGGRGRE
jgi:hypothetical protein